MTDLLVDTSVAVPLVLAPHEAHELVRDAVGERSVALAGHAGGDLRRADACPATPGSPRPTPPVCSPRFEPAVLLDVRSARSAPSVLADHGIAGGATYDGLIALAARRSGLALGSRDRRRGHVPPAGSGAGAAGLTAAGVRPALRPGQSSSRQTTGLSGSGA